MSGAAGGITAPSLWLLPSKTASPIRMSRKASTVTQLPMECASTLIVFGLAVGQQQKQMFERVAGRGRAVLVIDVVTRSVPRATPS